MWDSSLLDNNQSEPATKANQKISECVIHYISPGLPNKRLAEDISLRLAGVILFFSLPKAIPPFPTLLSGHYILGRVFVFVR